VVLGQTHKDRLAAALLGQEKFTGRQVGVHGDGVGTLEIAHGAAKSFLDRSALPQIVFDPQGDHFCVGGDLLGYGIAAALPLLPESQVVVDVPVEAGVDHALVTASLSCGGIIHRMAVGDGDGPYRGPAGMGRNGVESMGVACDDMQDGVPGDLPAQVAHVVTQAAHLFRHFVSERDAHPSRIAVGVDADGAIAQDGLVRPLLDLVGQTGVGPLALQRCHLVRGQDEEQGYARRVPSAHLQPVDAVEHRVQVVENFDHSGWGGRFRAFQQCIGLGDIRQDLRFQAPGGILELFDAQIGFLGIRGGDIPHLLLERAILLPGEGRQLVRPRADARLHGRVGK
jgi:hypothetical protein